MEVFVAGCAFVADWLLFVFPLYQGRMELMESNSVYAKYQSTHSKKKGVPFLYWLFPPLYFRYVKKQNIKGLNRLFKNKDDFRNFYGFYNKSIAWYFVSYAGFLNAIESTYGVLEDLELGFLTIPLFLVIVTSLFILGHHYVNYMASNQHRIRFIKSVASDYHRIKKQTPPNQPKNLD
ncbi:hypothetical protein B808_508 [Fructilactobacillus florum 8D]|uniref:Glycosyl-4,4'-diaponeurosporenoate acyltransferase n=1 Tax=Fructilactobacillus florum 8D TaxID=1221538 RepID=W9ELK7_9LACO|nr:hypothetical protein [Fructilactobacillus florum]EKK20419.1 hypothetical protein B807_828 [Fructilactobacillus florum 2F]ETO40559.1 hypothetical protein B808_508 [Fructilactobacillus florum 8D]